MRKLAGLQANRRPARNVYQNLFWAPLCNTAAFPVVASGLLRPMLAGANMGFRSTSVVSKGLRLRRFRTRESRPRTAATQ